MTSPCTSQRRRKYISNETPNKVSVECRQDVSVVFLHDILLECCNNVTRGRNNDVTLVRLHDVSNKSQTKHPKTSQWYVSCNSQMKHPITSLWLVSTTSRNYVVATPCFYYDLSFVFKLLCHDLHLVGFHVSFKYQIKHQIFLVPTRKETKEAVWVIT